MKIAIVRLSAIGDIIQSMIVLQFIKRRYPNASIDWFIDSEFGDLLDGCDEINNVIKLNIKEIKARKSLSLLRKLLRKLKSLDKYDKVIDLQGLVKSAIVSKILSADERIGFDENSSRERLASMFYSKKFYFPYGENVIRRYLGLTASALGFSYSDQEIFEKKPFFKLPRNNKTKHTPTIVIVLGASFQSKIYPVEKYATVVNSLDAKFIALCYSSKELEMAKSLQTLTKKISITKCSNFSELKTLIGNCDVVIGGDTGPTHLAWAMNKRSITIFGSTPKDRNYFATDKNIAISYKNKVNPLKVDKKDFSINKIDPDQISFLLNKLLSK